MRKDKLLPPGRFDRNLLESYVDQNARIRLYYEGLQRAHVEQSDNFPKQCRFYSLQQLAEFAVRGKTCGDFAECGCWKGHSTYIISRILLNHGFANRFHVFDSFEGGLSDKMPEDLSKQTRQTEDAIRSERQRFSSSQQETQQTLAEFPFVTLYKGWIPSRFQEVQQRKFSFIHIDVDLYQPTLASLEFFYPRLLSGGVVVIDDYGYAAFPGAKVAVDQFLRRNAHHMFYESPTGGGFILK